ncbi:hypothetical protein KM043_001785 [Ampulex compressa]|nr:hypothetical protein KM043_001785 [Ampulex compressa]
MTTRETSSSANEFLTQTERRGEPRSAPVAKKVRAPYVTSERRPIRVARGAHDDVLGNPREDRAAEEEPDPGRKCLGRSPIPRHGASPGSGRCSPPAESGRVATLYSREEREGRERSGHRVRCQFGRRFAS